jgi:hypothetical protein
MSKKGPLSKAFHRFVTQRCSAVTRGIEFKLSFEEWYDWWLSNGVDKNDYTPIRGGAMLCMCRHNDSGAYELSNIYCTTMAKNSSDLHKFNPQIKKFRTYVKRVHTPLGDFDSMAESAIAHSVSYHWIRNRIKTKPAEFYFL